MSNEFFIPEERLATLKSTLSGRSGEGGYNYQRAYAVARLAAMRTGQPLLGLADYPKRLRYDWADDLDEVLGDGSVCFTQCKRVDDIGAPAKLAAVLLGFVPKFLWIPEQKRPHVRFRLISCDPRFIRDFDKQSRRAEVWINFKSQLDACPSPQSDRAKWHKETDSTGHENLFDGIWQSLEFVHLDKDVVLNDPAGALLPAEQAALDHLSRWNVIWGETRKEALNSLRRLLHENLIAFDFVDRTEPALPNVSPHTIDAAEVRVALFAKEKDAPPLPFMLVDRIHLSNARGVERKRFLFEAPEWHHVAHGADEILKFVERDQTASLAQEVRERLIAPVRRGTVSLPALFVTGPPGAGKSTLVRRVAAQLIEAGEVVVADAGHNLANIVPGGVEPYVQQLTKLALQGRLVLLVLDDPLSANSEWIELLQHLKKPGLQVAVIAPTPDLLFHNHQHELRGVEVYAFPVSPPSATEKRALLRLYGHALNESKDLPDDFLVMVAEASEGKAFPEIMRRLWETLNGGHGISPNASFKELPWPVRAFWFVCALHRTYTACPLTILHAALAQSGGTGGLDVPTSLAKLKAQGGWRVFRLAQPSSSLFRAVGELISASHQKIASVAWEMRPGSWWDGEVIRLIVDATLRAQPSALYVAAAAVILAKAKSNSDSTMANQLMQQWAEAAAKDEKIETRSLCALVGALRSIGRRELLEQMSPSLRQRAKGSDGWLAAMYLHILSADNSQERSVAIEIGLGALIAEANFSIAPGRAIWLFKNVREVEYRNAIVSRLCASLDGRLDWKIDAFLLTWLISHAPKSAVIQRLQKIKEWLTEHDDDTTVRTQFLAFIQQLPPKFYELRKQTGLMTSDWLVRHEDDTSVRTQFLAFIQKLPNEKQFNQLREQAAIKTAKWIVDHDDDTAVRVQFLGFIEKLPNEKRFDQLREQTAIKTAKWIVDHDENASVRAKFLSFIQKLPKEKRFDQLREQTATKTARWLVDHVDDSSVRTQFLAFIQQLPPKFDELRKQAGLMTSDWLKTHPESLDVCAAYVSFLLAVRSPDLAALEVESITYHQRIIAKNYAAMGSHLVFGNQLLRLKKFAEAKAEFEFVVAQEPRHQLAHRGLAIALSNLGDSKMAEEFFKRALLLAEENGGDLEIFYTSIGMFYLNQKRWLEAIKSFEEAKNGSPKYFGNHWGLAKAQNALGMFPEAEQSLRLALDDQELRSPAKEEIEEFLTDISQKIRGSAAC